ncbi:MAG: hypothetical protein RLP15_02160 [Cryomorphaceae bacterium]
MLQFNKWSLGILCISLLLSVTSTSAQRVATWEKSSEDKKELKKFGNNYFHAITFVPMTGLTHYTVDPIPSEGFGAEPSTRLAAWTFFSLGYQARYNLLNHRDRFSISVSAEPYWDIVSRPSFESQGGSEDSNKKGIFLGVDLNLWNHSTFNNLDDRGMSLSAGLHLNKVARYPSTRAGFARITYKYVRYKRSFFSVSSVDPNKQVFRFIALQVGYGGDSGKADVPYNAALEYRLILARIIGY